MKKYIVPIGLAFVLAGCQNNTPVIQDYQVTNTIITPSMTKTVEPTPGTQATKSGETIALSKFATIKTTMGDIKIELFGDKTPITVSNFVGLATGTKEWTHPATNKKMTDTPFYDGIIFHRVIKDFMIQVGDPLGKGYGGPGYKFADEPFDGEYTRGTVAMANSGPNTNGSQFFIMHQDMGLPKNYVIFGKVVKGIEVVDKIAETETDPSDKPIKDIKIISVAVSDK